MYKKNLYNFATIKNYMHSLVTGMQKDRITFVPVYTSTKEFYPNESEAVEVPHVFADILINGVSLLERLSRYELKFKVNLGQEGLAGQYMCIDPESLYKQFTKYNPDHGIQPFQCRDCMSSLCSSSFRFKLKKTLGTVTFYGYSQVPFADKLSVHKEMKDKVFWDYSGFDEFTFDRSQFNKALSELRKFFILLKK